ncbi:hypothetical protein LSAT2_012111 [Lamellibrachia satsuma]|nr:hypothetical protein LSAT2_012111 [Lamellibrachia satsuma]
MLFSARVTVHFINEVQGEDDTGTCCIVSTVKLLQSANEKKDQQVKALESRIDDLDQYSRIDDVIISGLVTTHQTYAWATATKITDNVNTYTEAPQGELATLEDKVAKFFHCKGIDIEPNDISACHMFGTGTINAPSTQHRTAAPPRIILPFANRKRKVSMLRMGENYEKRTFTSMNT